MPKVESPKSATHRERVAAAKKRVENDRAKGKTSPSWVVELSMDDIELDTD